MRLPDGTLVDGLSVDIEISHERWSDFEFADGTKVRAKIILIEAVRAASDYDPDGRPYYQINLQAVTTIDEVPERLLKKKEE